jgi:chromate reductase, NAD(P)H dehydrogenase (quinone)
MTTATTTTTSPAVRVLAISGSLRDDSRNRRLLETAAEMAQAGVHVELWDGLKQVPPFDEDDEHDPALPVRRLRAAFAAADGVLIATPEYNGSLPGQLKNALDWASRPYDSNVLRGKPVAIVGASPGSGGAAGAVADARRVLATIGARVLDREVAVALVHDSFDEEDRLVDIELGDALAATVDDVARESRTELELVA